MITHDAPASTSTGGPAAGLGLTRAVLLIAAIAFAAYPLLRGSGSEAGWSGAELYARPSWVLAHCLGMLGFVAISWVLRSFDVWAGRLALAGAILVLPYYGAESFGLHALGKVAIATGDPTMVAAADVFRYQPVAMVTFAAGLLALAAAGVRMIMLVRRAGDPIGRVGMILVGIALITYLPQFFTPIEVRIAHGVLLGLGLLILAIRTPPRTTR